MKKDEQRNDDELREEYDMAAISGVVRGKYAQSYKESSNVVVLDPDVAEAFPNQQAVNDALRMLINIAKSSTR